MHEDPRLVHWRIYMDCHASVLQSRLPRIGQLYKVADDTTRLMLNALLILNSGGIATIPAIRTMAGQNGVSDNSLVVSGVIFFLGLLFALLAGIATIWNYRSLAKSDDEAMNATLVELRGRFPGIIEPPKVDELERIRQKAEKSGAKVIPLTFWGGWIFGVFSAIAFGYGGASLGGSINPICTTLGSLCLTMAN